MEKKLNSINKSVILNCGYSKGLSVKQVVNEFKKNIKKTIKVVFLNRRKGDMEKITADNKKIKKFLSWRPKYNKLSLIVKSSLKWESKLNI